VSKQASAIGERMSMVGEWSSTSDERMSAMGEWRAKTRIETSSRTWWWGQEWEPEHGGRNISPIIYQMN